MDALRRLLPSLLLVVGALTWTSQAVAEVRPVLERRQQGAIEAMFRPYSVGKPVANGWALWDVDIEPIQIAVGLKNTQTGTKVTFWLRHPEFTSSSDRTKSFAVDADPSVREGPAAEAFKLVMAAVRANDAGGLWSTPRSVIRQKTRVEQAPISSWVRDGLVQTAFIFLVLLSLAWRAARGAPRWVLPALLVVTVGGALLRWWIAPEAVLGAWPFSRLEALPRLTFHGLALPALADRAGGSLYLTEVIHALTFVFAVFAPLAMFAHGRYLVRDARLALLAAFLVAVLPMHIRFSRSEVAFMTSLVLSSVSLALTHVALRDESRLWRGVALVAAIPIIWAIMFVRPLNVLFVPVLFGVGLLTSRDLPKGRVVGVVGTVAAVGAVAAGIELSADHGTQVGEGLSLTTVQNGLRILVDPQFNSLLSPRVTPPLFLVLAVYGAVSLWRTNRRLMLLLLGWIVMFLMAHAVVVPDRIEMQARYHLHLIVPFLLLTACGVQATVERFERHRRRLVPALLAALALSPLFQLSFVRDLDFNLPREYAFVSSVRERIPEGCTVLEFATGEPGDLRFTRIGDYYRDGRYRQRFDARVTTAPRDHTQRFPKGADPLTSEARAILAKPPECLMIYRGLSCYSFKHRDEDIAPACSAVASVHPLVPVETVQFQSRYYDAAMSDGLTEGQGVELGLYRVRPR